MRRKPVVTFVVAMVVMVMVLFGIERAGRSAGHLGARRADYGRQGSSGLRSPIDRRQDRSALGFSREGGAAEFLGNLLRALQDRDAVVCRAAG